jgi:hypothetical protein
MASENNLKRVLQHGRTLVCKITGEVSAARFPGRAGADVSQRAGLIT